MLQFLHIRLWTGVILFVVLLTGCAKETTVDSQEPQPMPIALQGYVAHPTGNTRVSAIYKSDSIPDGMSIGVYAYYHQNSTWSTDAILASDFMFNQQATYNRIDDAYMYAPLKYWPNTPNDKLSFIAYYPYTDKTIVDPLNLESSASTGITPNLENSGSGLPTFDFTVKNDESNQVDFLVSDLLANQVKPSVTERIHLYFHHALAKVSFRIVIADDIRKDIAAFNVTSIGLTNLSYQGTLTPSYDGLKTTLTWDDWDSPTTSYTCSPEKSYLLMPQSLTDDADLTMSYSLTFKSGGTAFIYDGEGNAIESATYQYSTTASLQLNTLKRTGSEECIDTWEANHHYIYTIRLSANRIEFTGQVVEWGEDVPFPIDVDTPES